MSISFTSSIENPSNSHFCDFIASSSLINGIRQVSLTGRGKYSILLFTTAGSNDSTFTLHNAAIFWRFEPNVVLQLFSFRFANNLTIWNN